MSDISTINAHRMYNRVESFSTARSLTPVLVGLSFLSVRLCLCWIFLLVCHLLFV